MPHVSLNHIISDSNIVYNFEINKILTAFSVFVNTKQNIAVWIMNHIFVPLLTVNPPVFTIFTYRKAVKCLHQKRIKCF